jgi:UDP-glucose 4-epimerase
MKILVTGGSGFLGRVVVAHLKSCGHEVWNYDNLDSRCGGHAKPTVPWDVRNIGNFQDVLDYERPDAIIHLAAYGRNLTCERFRREAWDVNVNGTVNVLEAAREMGLKRVIVCSSNIVLSPKPTMYKFTKETVERSVAYYQSLGLSCLALRPSNICGPGQSRTEYQPCAMAGMDLAIERDGVMQITGDGTQTRDWIHVQDVARAFGMALGSSYAGLALDICTGKQTSLNEIAKLLAVPIQYTDPRPGDAMQLISDPEPAKRVLGFEARIGMDRIVRDSFPSVYESHRASK